MEKKRNRTMLLILLLLLITILCIGVTIWALFFRAPDQPLTPDYQPPELEENVEKVEGDGTKLEAPSGGGSIRVEYVDSVTVDLSEKTVSLSYTHPANSTHNIVLQLRIQEEVLMQSGTILPGSRVTQLGLLENAEKKLSPGGYDGELVILTYDPDSGEKTMIDTKAKVSVTVVE